ncbi:MAG TPA: peroxiredoxin-like family protein [Terriglobales bacterium]
MKWRSLEGSSSSTDTRSLREQLAERKELIAQYVPPETRAIHARVIADLKQDRVEARTLPIGAKVPAFELHDHRGRVVTSSDLLAKGKLVICFFRGRWCPFCVGQLEAMNQVLPQIQAAGANLIAISPQTVQQSFFMADQHRLQYPLLSDAGNRVARQFGLVYRVPEQQRDVYRRAFINLPFTNGDDSWELPIPASYILDWDGTAIFTSADADYTERPEPRKILETLV